MCRGGERREASDPRRFPSAVGLEVLRHQSVPHGPALHVAVLRAHRDRAHVQVPAARPACAAAPGIHFLFVLKPHFLLFMIFIDFSFFLNNVCTFQGVLCVIYFAVLILFFVL